MEGPAFKKKKNKCFNISFLLPAIHMNILTVNNGMHNWHDNERIAVMRKYLTHSFRTNIISD